MKGRPRDFFERHRILIFLVTVLLYFLLAGINAMAVNTSYGHVDTGSYLARGKDIALHGGPLGLIRDLFAGEYKYANIHPLFVSLVSFVSVESVQMFVYGRLLTFALAVLSILVIYFSVRLVLGEVEAMAAAAVMVLSRAYLFHATIVAPESLLVLLVAAAWCLGQRALDDRGNGREALLFGVLAGLSYLTKGTAQVILAAFVIALLYQERFSFWCGRRLYLSVGGFVLTALPLLWRNVVVYGTPFYNYNNPLIWSEGWHQRNEPGFWDSPPGLLTYIERHGLGGLIERLVNDFVPQISYLGELFRPVKFMPEHGFLPTLTYMRLTFLIGLAVLTLALWGLRSHEKRAKGVFSLFTILGFFAVATLVYHITPSLRFLFPILPIVAAYAVRGILRLAQKKEDQEAVVNGAAMLLSLVMITSSVLILSFGTMCNPLHSVEVDPTLMESHHYLLETLRKSGDEEGKIYTGPVSDDLFWNSKRLLVSCFNLPLLKEPNWERLNELAEEENVNWLLLRPEARNERKELFEGYISLTLEDGLVVDKALPGWDVAGEDESEPVEWILFRRTGSRAGTTGEE